MKDTARASEPSDQENDPHIWMIRTSDNVLSGPYTQAQVIQLVEEEKLELTDEICRGNSYWIYLHEEQEVKKHLGIEVPAALVEPEEPTQTETDSIISRRAEPQQTAAMGARAQRGATISPDHAKLEAAKAEAAREAAKIEYTPVVEKDESVDDVPELQVSADSIEDHTAVLNNRAFREFRPREQIPTSPPPAAVTEASPPPLIIPSQEQLVDGFSVVQAEAEGRKRFWILTFVVLIVGAGAMFYAWKRLHT
jgi:hypothetical protein